MFDQWRPYSIRVRHTLANSDLIKHIDNYSNQHASLASDYVITFSSVDSEVYIVFKYGCHDTCVQVAIACDACEYLVI